MSDWSSGEIEELLCYQRAGLSASEISDLLEYSRSRNSVIGKLSRLGIKGLTPAEKKLRLDEIEREVGP